MNPVERVIRRLDAFQQGRPPLAFLVAVIKKFGDDSAGSLAALIAYYGFLALFPLLLVLITVLGLVFANDPGFQHRVVNSALSQFPIVANQLAGPLALLRGAVIAGVAWAMPRYVGSYLVGHPLRHSSQVYGSFASILGLIGFLSLASPITLYAAELNVVRARRLYPRSIVQPPLTPADQRVLADIATVGERRPEQRAEVVIDTGRSPAGEAAGPAATSGTVDAGRGERG